MHLAYLLLPALMVAWVLVAIVVTHARERGISIFHFFMCGSFLATLIFLAICLTTGCDNFFAPRYRTATAMLAMGAIFNGSCQAVLMYNLKKGGRALAFAIPQLGFILPYAWSIVFRDEKFACTGGIGLICIAGAICFLAAKKSSTTETTVTSSLDAKRILISFAAMLIGGMAQIFFSYPAFLPADQQLSTITGSLIIQAASTLLFFFFALVSPVKFTDGIKKAGKFSLLWALGAVLSYCILLPTLEEMRKLNQAGLVYPIGCGGIILLFALYTSIRGKEKLSAGQIAAFAAIIIGIFLVRM